MFYFDANAGSKLAPGIRERLAGVASGNPASAHRLGQQAKADLETAREQLAEALDCPPERLIFTSGGTESVVTALYSAFRPQRRPILAVAATDHPNSRKSAAHLAKMVGGQVRHYPIDRFGCLMAVPDYLDETSVINVQAAHSETGALLAAEVLIDLLGETVADRQGALLHVDACQLLGKTDPAPWMQCADLVSFSAHKLGGLPGSGLLYVRPDLPLRPLFGGEQEWRRRAGTPNLFGAVAFAEAARLRCRSDCLATQRQQWFALTDHLRSGLSEIFPDIEWLTPTDHDKRLPQTLFFRIPQRRSHPILMFMDQRDVCLSAGTACRSGLVEANETLLALGYTDQDARESIRVSLDWNCTQESIEYLLRQFKELASRPLR